MGTLRNCINTQSVKCFGEPIVSEELVSALFLSLLPQQYFGSSVKFTKDSFTMDKVFQLCNDGAKAHMKKDCPKRKEDFAKAYYRTFIFKTAKSGPAKVAAVRSTRSEVAVDQVEVYIPSGGECTAMDMEVAVASLDDLTMQLEYAVRLTSSHILHESSVVTKNHGVLDSGCGVSLTGRAKVFVPAKVDTVPHINLAGS
ncbi:hypothetical protein B5M09_011517 [Aphanomyces astaci]|uniref:Uncharacterized protein n=1 Tax=Aphanomyces astaci TaxID=112090 RepID=A0A3R7Y5J1_APHAT|nr:hypothetical protein B5M09_011517 [Aphanomyces astaci]